MNGAYLEYDAYCAELRLALEFNGFLHEVAKEAFGGQKAFKAIQ